MDDKGCLCIATDCASSDFPMNDTTPGEYAPTEYPVEEQSVDLTAVDQLDPPAEFQPADTNDEPLADPVDLQPADTNHHNADPQNADPRDADLPAADLPEADAEGAAGPAAPAVDPADERNRCVIEAILFSSDVPIGAAKLAEMLEGCTPSKVRKHIDALNEKYAAAGLTFRIEPIARGYQMMTLPEYHEWLDKLNDHRQETRLSGAALETLSIIAYKQPVIRADIEAIRGVAGGEVVNRLREMGLVRILGRAEIVGRPLLYGTTKKFLDIFGLADLDDLPPMEALQTKPASKPVTKPLDEVEPTPPPPVKTPRKPRKPKAATIAPDSIDPDSMDRDSLDSAVVDFASASAASEADHAQCAVAVGS
jgi:segregation and condensation protein B